MARMLANATISQSSDVTRSVLQAQCHANRRVRRRRARWLRGARRAAPSRSGRCVAADSGGMGSDASARRSFAKRVGARRLRGHVRTARSRHPATGSRSRTSRACCARDRRHRHADLGPPRRAATRARAGGVYEIPMRVRTRLFGTLELPYRLRITSRKAARRWPGARTRSRSRGCARASSSQPHHQPAPPGHAAGARRQRARRIAGGSPAAPKPERRSSPLGRRGHLAARQRRARCPPSSRANWKRWAFRAPGPVGLSGLELALDCAPAGNARGASCSRETRVLASARAAPGTGAAHEHLPRRCRPRPSRRSAAQYGGIVAMRPSGQILAVAGIGLDGLQPPGSTFKMVTLSARAGRAHRPAPTRSSPTRPTRRSTASS